MSIQEKYIENLGFSMVLIENDETFSYWKHLIFLCINILI